LSSKSNSFILDDGKSQIISALIVRNASKGAGLNPCKKVLNGVEDGQQSSPPSFL
jgi:hypothetical protein